VGTLLHNQSTQSIYTITIIHLTHPLSISIPFSFFFISFFFISFFFFHHSSLISTMHINTITVSFHYYNSSLPFHYYHFTITIPIITVPLLYSSITNMSITYIPSENKKRVSINNKILLFFFSLF